MKSLIKIYLLIFIQVIKEASSPSSIHLTASPALRHKLDLDKVRLSENTIVIDIIERGISSFLFIFLKALPEILKKLGVHKKQNKKNILYIPLCCNIGVMLQLSHVCSKAKN